jgi:hypothetical protein
MEFGWQIVLGSLIGFFGAAFGSVGGVGGGGIFVPMLTLIIGFDPKSSTAISKCEDLNCSSWILPLVSVLLRKRQFARCQQSMYRACLVYSFLCWFMHVCSSVRLHLVSFLSHCCCSILLKSNRVVPPHPLPFLWLVRILLLYPESSSRCCSFH